MPKQEVTESMKHDQEKKTKEDERKRTRVPVLPCGSSQRVALVDGTRASVLIVSLSSHQQRVLRKIDGQAVTTVTKRRSNCYISHRTDARAASQSKEKLQSTAKYSTHGKNRGKTGK